MGGREEWAQLVLLKNGQGRQRPPFSLPPLWTQWSGVLSI